MSENRAYVRKKYTAKDFKRFAKKHPVAGAVITVLVALFFIYSIAENHMAAQNTHRDGLYVHYIDVGQGDCELIECNGEFMLIDAGWPENGSDVIKYLRSSGVSELEYVVCSHGDADHCGGLEAVVKRFHVKTVFVPPYGSDSVFYSIFLSKLENADLEPTVPEMGESYELGGAAVKFIGPAADFADDNENSLILRLEYGKTSFLFTGDVERLGEQALLDSGAKLKCDVLKVAHHGSYTSTSYQFLCNADPDIAVISCGKDNEYGHPHDVVLSRLKDAGVTVYRTDTMGTVVFFSDGEKIERLAA